MNFIYNEFTEKFSSNLSQIDYFNNESLLYDNNDSFDNHKSPSELDPDDYQDLYNTINNKERISEEKTLSKEEKKLNSNVTNTSRRLTSISLNRGMILQKRKENEKLFDIKKEKRLGRKRKNQKSAKKSGHTEFTKDNIMNKIERNVLDSSKDFLNILIKEADNKEIKELTLKKIDTSILNSKKEEKERILKMSLKELFSLDISKKFTYFPKDYNKIIIDKILKQNDKVLNEALDTSFEYMIKLYSEEEKPENNIYNNFNTVTSNQKLLKEAPNYIKKYKNILQNFFMEFDKIIPRKKNKVPIQIKKFLLLWDEFILNYLHIFYIFELN